MLFSAENLNSAYRRSTLHSHSLRFALSAQVKLVSLKKYVELYDVNVRNDLTPHELSVAVAR